MYSVLHVSVIIFAVKTPAFYLYEMNTFPLHSSFAIEWEILQDATEFPRAAKVHIQFSASDSNKAALVFRRFCAKERGHRSVDACLQNFVCICFYIYNNVIP